MTDVLGRSITRQRFALILIGAFAGISLLLAALGLYGVLAYSVRQRTQEIGIRMALGATARQLRWMVFKQAAVIVAAGIAFGVGGALLLGRWLSALVFKVSPWEPAVLLTTALLLILMGLVSAWLPARRVTRFEARAAMQEP